MNDLNHSNIKWTENVIIADADYIDKVAFNLTVNFERILNRKIPQADISQWAVDIALDGGLREGDHETQIVFIHEQSHSKLENFRPSVYDKELNAQAFKDPKLGEFILSSISTEKTICKDDLLIDIVNEVISQKEVKRVMVIPDAEEGEQYNRIRQTLSYLNDDSKRITVFAMQPMPGGNFRQEILGYSLMNALGIHADEINRSSF
ncbi:MAG: hypothetical protein LKF70_09910 [Prevotella sp.]|jgi:hypothetical protein|nr:hypothetical protein [Prevotella sp.]MCH4242353.1 hypothetical protein [Prevotella sp.]